MTLCDVSFYWFMLSLTWGPFPRVPTKEQQPQGLSVNTIQLGCSEVLSTNWKLEKIILKQFEFCVSVPGCRCSSPNASSPAWTKLCGRHCKWSELDQRTLTLMSWDAINDLGLRCEFHQFAKNRSSSLSPAHSLKQSEHKCIILITLITKYCNAVIFVPKSMISILTVLT